MVRGSFNKPFGRDGNADRKQKKSSPEADRKFVSGLRLAEHLRIQSQLLRMEVRDEAIEVVDSDATHKILFGDYEGQLVKVGGYDEKGKTCQVVFVGGKRAGMKMFLALDQIASL